MRQVGSGVDFDPKTAKAREGPIAREQIDYHGGVRDRQSE